MSDVSKQTSSNDPRVQAALRDYLERVDRGEFVDKKEFVARHAEIAEALRSFFEAEEPFRKIEATKISPGSAGISTRSFAETGQETVPPSKADCAGCKRHSKKLRPLLYHSLPGKRGDGNGVSG